MLPEFDGFFGGLAATLTAKPVVDMRLLYHLRATPPDIALAGRCSTPER